MRSTYDAERNAFLDLLGIPCDICGDARCDGFCNEEEDNDTDEEVKDGTVMAIYEIDTEEWYRVYRLHDEPFTGDIKDRRFSDFVEVPAEDRVRINKVFENFMAVQDELEKLINLNQA